MQVTEQDLLFRQGTLFRRGQIPAGCTLALLRHASQACLAWLTRYCADTLWFTQRPCHGQVSPRSSNNRQHNQNGQEYAA